MLKRTITAIVAVAVFIPICIFSDTFVWPAAMALLSLIAAYEMLGCVGMRKSIPVAVPSYVIGALLPLIPLSGGLMTQFQGTADVNMGRGSIVIGLAAIIIGEVLCSALFRKGTNFAVTLGFVALGGVLYYGVMTVILWLRLDPNDLKLFTALIVAVFLAVPHLQEQRRSSFRMAGKQA